MPLRLPSRRLLRALPAPAQNLLLAAATVLLVGATAEGLARRFETRHPVPPPIADYITRWGEGESEFYTIKSSATGWPPWEDYNSEGVRDREHAVAKPSGVRRVIALGDSVTLGFGLPPEDAYPQLLQDRLDALGQPVEVMNVALGGWATRHERVAYQRIARKYGPDLVILGVCLNDLAELQNDQARPPRWLGALHRRSALVRWAVGAHRREIHTIEELFQHRQAPAMQAAFRRFFAEAEALQREVQRDGVALAVLILPFRGQMSADAPPPAVQDEITSFFLARGVPVLDPRAALRELGEAAFLDHVHLTAEGSARVADVIAESGLIPSAEGAEGVSPMSALAEARKSDLPALLAALQAPEDVSRAAAARALGNAGLDPAACIPPLIRALADPSAQVRAAATWAVGRFGPQTAPALPGLVAALQDGDARVRAGAAWAIGRIGPEARDRAAASLVRGLTDSEPNIRRRAGDALVRVGAQCQGCLATLIEIVARPDSPGRAAAARALGGLGPAAAPATSALVSALDDPHADVRGRAAWALGRVGPAARDAVAALVARVDDPASGWRMIDALGGIGPGAAAAVPRLSRALQDPSGNVRWRAAQALGQIGPPARDASADLAAALGDPESNVRLAAARAALRIDADSASILPALARALSDADSRVRAAAAQGLGRLGPRSHPHLPALLAATRDPDPLVRVAAARALRHMGPSAETRAVLADVARHDPDESVRAEARRALHPLARAEP